MRTVRRTMAVALLAPLLPGGAQAAVRVQDVGVLNPVLAPGATTKIKIVVRNTGRRAARGGAIRLRLDRKPLGRPVRLGRLKGRSSKTVTTRARLPKGIRPGAHALKACLGRSCAKQADPIGLLPKANPAPALTPRIADGGLPGAGVISRDGGSLYAVGPDNRSYQLVVPPGALASDVRVEIKPLARVDGLPFAAGMTAGVQLEPAGLEFARPAALIISGDGISPQAGQVVVGYEGNGRDPHLSGWFVKIPAWLDGAYDPSASLVIPVEHFSGLAVAPATDLETARQLRYDAQDARNRLVQTFADAINRERDRQLGKGGEPVDLSALTDATLYAYLEEVILPEAAAASFSDAMYESAVRDSLSWERQRQLLGAGEAIPERYRKLIARIEELLRIAWDKVVERAEKRCYGGDYSIIARIIPLERERELLGTGEGRPNDFSEALKRCFRFELRVVSRVEHKGEGFGASVDEAYELKSTVRLRLQGDGLGLVATDLTGTAPFPYASARHTSSGELDFGPSKARCNSKGTGRTIPGQLTVSQGWLGYTIRGTDVKQAYKPFLVLDVGDPQEEINRVCRGSAFGEPYNTDENVYERNWLRYWSAVHQDERPNADQNPWDPNGGPQPGPWRLEFTPKRWPLVGSYVLDFSDATYGFRVVETWELVHMPPKAPPAKKP